MTLSESQRRKTSQELISNFEIAGLSNAEVQEALAFTPEQLAETLTVGSKSTSEDVVRLRDFLLRKIVEQGDEPLTSPIL
jgi:hypothetical protein